jgi:hypothetical protein
MVTVLDGLLKRAAVGSAIARLTASSFPCQWAPNERLKEVLAGRVGYQPLS